MSMYNIALSGAMANQAAMNITAQNTANMNTDGYTRKVVNQATVVYGSQAGGVTVESIRRVSDQAAVERLRTASQEMQYAQAYMSGMQNIENLLGMEGLNLNSGFSELFAAIDEATISPESLVYRTQIIASADNLASRFNGIMSQLETQLNSLVQQQETTVSTINSQLENIADLNAQIRDASGQGKDISGYQDALDLQLAELSKSIGVNVLQNQDGTVELSTKSGQPLVVGNNVATIEKNLSAGGQFNTDLQLTFNGQTSTLQSPKGGELGAFDKLKDEQYLPLMDDINAIAVGFADAMNEILATGTDLNGDSPGKALFSYDPSNPAGSLSVTGISAEELALSIDGNAGDGSIATAMSELASQPIRIDGRDINVFDAYSEILGTIGIATSQAQANYETATISINEAQTARDSVSAVSSNEEAANLMMYMNAYEANMKVIATANQMFDTVLNSF
ncbi:flagellar hook-associated protein 1 FlgK [Vibrio xiamenensis]|uniref:Flagellar hook-associated protein 1 n=1 Tax=Vibrio xiamenensis TaxID=861298 RepID=A0A1G7ZYD1_9VIBR|nr:flagellar hook-associated protein FlgK [Vibrio xiamenensis]SDH13663.1 flagellar hook-associated protein 1 FlgK [Vibrio xiamenensis]